MERLFSARHRRPFYLSLLTFAVFSASRFSPDPHAQLASLVELPLVDSSRLRRPPAPPVRSARPPQGPVATLPLHLDPVLLRPPRHHRLPDAYGGFRNAFGVFYLSFQKEGRFAPVGNQTNRPSFRKDFWGGLVVRETLGNFAGTHLGERP